MAAITYANMQTKLALQANNMQSNDPFYGYLGATLNEAANALILLAAASDRRNMNLFPELRKRRWYDLSVTAQGYMTKPSNLLIVDSVAYTKLTTTYNPSTDTEYPSTEEPDQARFGLLAKNATGYPTRWQDAATQVLIWPTPSAAYLTQIVLRGIRQESDLSANSDTFTMDAKWHPVVIDYATYLMMKRMGLDDADKWLAMVKERVSETINLVGLSNRRNMTTLKIAGAA